MNLPVSQTKSWTHDKSHGRELLSTLLERLWNQGQARQQLIEVLHYDSGGRFHLVDADHMDAEGERVDKMIIDSPASTQTVRHRLRQLLVDLPSEQVDALELAVGEVAGNVVKHADRGTCEFFISPSRVTVRISDQGPGILPANLHKSLNIPGFSTKDSLGMGYTLILTLVDEIWLSTGPGGTSVQLAKKL